MDLNAKTILDHKVVSVVNFEIFEKPVSPSETLLILTSQTILQENMQNHIWNLI